MGVLGLAQRCNRNRPRVHLNSSPADNLTSDYVLFSPGVVIIAHLLRATRAATHTNWHILGGRRKLLSKQDVPYMCVCGTACEHNGQEGTILTSPRTWSENNAFVMQSL